MPPRLAPLVYPNGLLVFPAITVGATPSVCQWMIVMPRPTYVNRWGVRLPESLHPSSRIDFATSELDPLIARLGMT